MRQYPPPTGAIQYVALYDEEWRPPRPNAMPPHLSDNVTRIEVLQSFHSCALFNPPSTAPPPTSVHTTAQPEQTLHLLKQNLKAPPVVA